MRTPFALDAGLLFGIIRTDADWQRLVADQASIAQQSPEDAERILLDGLRLDPHASGSPLFTDGKRGKTLREWAAEEAAKR